MLAVVWLLGFFAHASAQIRGQGVCPQPNPIPNFDEKRLIGRWFEWAHIENVYQRDQSCEITTYYRNSDREIVKRVNSLIQSSGTWIFWEGKMIPRGESPTAQYLMKFPEYSGDIGINSTFVAANWKHWVILHGCKEETNQSSQFVWVWSKKSTLKSKYRKQIAEALEQINLPMRNLRRINQKNCANHRILDPTPTCR
ncbi:bilin-binding protein [Fopius arisanus]|uniref:Bilin-binding protein n=1 Tax=Fopius arisanus TaxID=64838 RepID=A0A9R1U453_9HYME|nr:PREDICTED: bilin-binding protein-like [Fopius arisanus]